MSDEEKKKRGYWKKFWSRLGFDIGPIDLEAMRDMKLDEILAENSPTEWFPIAGYSLTNEIIQQMATANKKPASLIRFLSTISRLEKIDGIRVCFIQYNGNWAAFIVNQEIQRTISFINHGDGWDKSCQFAVQSKSA